MRASHALVLLMLAPVSPAGLHDSLAGWAEPASEGGEASSVPASTHTLADGRVHTFYSWGIEAHGFPHAWEANLTGRGVPVAVIEVRGFDADHPYLVNDVAWCIDSRGTDGACDGGDEGADHGTHVAGIVHQGAPDSPLYLVSLGGPAAGPRELRAALVRASAGPDGVEGSADDARVAVASLAVIPATWTGPGGGIAIDTLQPLPSFPDLVLVAAAGNYGGLPGTVTYPATDATAIAVGALGADVPNGGVDPERVRTASSDGIEDDDDTRRSVGEVDVVASGGAVVSAMAGGSYSAMSGTSAAAPHVAGMVALLLERHEEATPEQVRAHLTCASTDLGVGAGRYTWPGHDLSSGFGRPTMARALSSSCDSSMERVT